MLLCIRLCFFELTGCDRGNYHVWMRFCGCDDCLGPVQREVSEWYSSAGYNEVKRKDVRNPGCAKEPDSDGVCGLGDRWRVGGDPVATSKAEKGGHSVAANFCSVVLELDGIIHAEGSQVICAMMES
jgi:hypothetical protein